MPDEVNPGLTYPAPDPERPGTYFRVDDATYGTHVLPSRAPHALLEVGNGTLGGGLLFVLVAAVSRRLGRGYKLVVRKRSRLRFRLIAVEFFRTEDEADAAERALLASWDTHGFERRAPLARREVRAEYAKLVR